jgi:hypothetical protein
MQMSPPSGGGGSTIADRMSCIVFDAEMARVELVDGGVQCAG